MCAKTKMLYQRYVWAILLYHNLSAHCQTVVHSAVAAAAAAHCHRPTVDGDSSLL